MRPFIIDNVSAGSVVISDAFSSYPNALAGSEYEHDPSTSSALACRRTRSFPPCTDFSVLAKL